jgi:fluoroacetyl-CoA thioesterase
MSAMQDILAHVEIGMTGHAEVVVTPDITVGGHVPGMPMVYGTPFMILLMEVASGRAIRDHLPEGYVSVGTHVDVRHLAPTPLGRRVTATSRVIEKTRSSVLFEVSAHDGERLIGEGRHRRGIVDGRGFGDKV